ncbi:hypothetical protein KC19_1G295300 [Ceratodon purpureus]|uniref:Uncharacterized protein n=1 Tax=Ceratodon purpureus TaxID=3225 RepID=A0A8T0JE79_CERPU|nr:hypothetical protein KC19_1G295300 [Ceratodon purpureus]
MFRLPRPFETDQTERLEHVFIVYKSCQYDALNWLSIWIVHASLSVLIADPAIGWLKVAHIQQQYTSAFHRVTDYTTYSINWGSYKLIQLEWLLLELLPSSQTVSTFLPASIR